jgi:hypothetical protein
VSAQLPVASLGHRAASPVIAAVESASAGNSARFANLLAVARLESGLRPDAAAATSSAKGLFQFVGQTWLDVVRRYGAAHGLATEAAAIIPRNGQLTVADPALRQHILDLRNDPQLAAALAADNLQAIGDRLASVLGRAPDSAELYLGHFLGAGGAVRMLQALQTAPGASAASVLPEAARTNAGLFAPNGQPCSVAQFIDRVRGRLAQAYASLGMVVPNLGASRSSDGAAALPQWSAGVPSQAASAEGRILLAQLAEIFLTADPADAAANQSLHRRQRQQPSHGLPVGVVASLAPGPGVTSPEPSTAVPRA